MSDNTTIIVPVDALYIPEPERQQRALVRVQADAYSPEAVEIHVYDRVKFFHCYANLNRISCPICHGEIESRNKEWWSDSMEADYRDGGFQLNQYETPCCATRIGMNELLYDWPMAFGRFAIVATGDVGVVDNALRSDIEDILATRIQIVYQRL